MLFAIILGLIPRITWSLPSVYSVYFGKIYRFIYAEFPKGNTIVGKRQIQAFRAQHTCYWARLKTVKGLFFDTFLYSCTKTVRMGRCWFYQNKISRRLPTVLFSVIILLLPFLPWLKTFPRIEVKDEIKLRIAQVCTFLCLKFLISAGEN